MLNQILENAEVVGQWILDSFLQEAIDEGHIMDVQVRGYAETAEQSLEVDVTFIDGERTLYIDLIGNDYLLKMNEFQSGGSINWNPEDMLDYGRRIYPGLTRQATINKLKSLRTYQKIAGVPNQRSFNYSKNGRRASFLKAGILDKQDEIETIVDLHSFVQYVVCLLLEDAGIEILNT